MRWKIADAKQHFSEVVRLAADEPQVIQNRDRVVAAVISGDAIDDFVRWRSERAAPSLADTLAEMREAASEENWDLEIPARANRPNALVSAKRLVVPAASPAVSAKSKRPARRARRHQRPQ